MKRRWMMLVFSVLLLLGFLGAIALPKASAQPLVPCADPRGCPDLTVNKNRLRQWYPVKATFSEDHCAVQEGLTVAGTRRLLLFIYTTPNQGLGDLIIGNPSDHPELFEFAPCHNHFHFKEYADYRLWTPEGYDMWAKLRSKADPQVLSRDLFNKHPELQEHLVVAAKAGFCLIDVHPAPIPDQPLEPAKYNDCNANQGLSTGWADEYHFLLDGQWVDVTETKAGTYVLEVEANAEHIFQEADYSNNASAVVVTVPPAAP
jgi:lysyl oxidase